MTAAGRDTERRAPAGQHRAAVATLHVAIPAVVLVATATMAAAHEGAPADPELLDNWRAQVHLLFQWSHLVAFGLWVGGMAAATRLRSLSLDALLFGSWALFFVAVASGSYNMQFSGAFPESPDILSWPILAGRWPFGDAYVILIAVKQALLVLAVAVTLVVSVLRLRRGVHAAGRRLRAAFLALSLGLGVSAAATTSLVLVLHEAVDLAPTPVHSLGGVVLPHDADETARARAATAAAPPPYGTDTLRTAAGFELFLIPRVALDAASRFAHLLGFALWTGAAATSLLVPVIDARRAVVLLWIGLGLQLVSGAHQLLAWTPFALTPLPWRLAAMTRFRFGYTYTLVLTLKLALAAIGALATGALTYLTRRRSAGSPRGAAVRALQMAHVAVALVLAYVAITLLLVHEGVDHAL